MPRTLSESERAYIRQKMMQETKKCLTLYGIRKTTVDEIVKRVNISKGTFYLFYKSKELLLFDVIMQFNDEVQEELIAEVSKIKDDIGPERLTDIIFSLYKRLDDSFLPKLLAEGELEYFMKKLPPELSQRHTEKDELKVGQLLGMLPDLSGQDEKVFSAAFRSIFLSILFKQEIGEEVFDQALRMMIRGVVMQLFEGDRL